MACKLSEEYPGAIYHVMNRGDQREDIFIDDEDRRKFLSTLGECCRKTVREETERLPWQENELLRRPKG